MCILLLLDRVLIKCLPEIVKTVGTSVPDLLNCHQKPAFNSLNLVVSIRAAMFISITV
jgi:hypothetical protein